MRDLRVTFLTDGGDVTAVDGVSLALGADEVLGIVGESGSGKSVTMMSVMRLVPERNTRFEGEVLYGGRDLMQLSRRTMREVRGSEIAMIFQDPMTSLNPVYTVGWQIAEQVRAHEGVSAAAARDRAIELLRSVGIPDAEQRVDDYPHQFSGGMRQRVMIAMALSCSPRVLIADEPTTALDVTIQAQILDLIRTLRRETGSSVVLITHDMGVVAELADRVLVMYGGRIVEQGPTRAIFHDPLHPYTWGLLGSIARLDRPRPHRLTAIGGTPRAGVGDAARAACSPTAARTASSAARSRRRWSPSAARTDHLDACWLPIEKRGELR